ncbi:MAG: metal-dependent hydrolase [Myxococcales bacterium]
MSQASRSMPDQAGAEPIPEIRNFCFDVGPAVPRYWHNGSRPVTLLFNNLSVFFPPGERFFVHSVKAYREQLRSEPLRRQVQAFCAQEGIHSREHVRYNEMLRAQGFPIDAMERRIERILAGVRHDPKRIQLAVTVCLEHFTALLAELLLQPDSTLLEGAHPAMAALWRWHAAEENEHKAVAFDVFEQVGGTYAERAVVMLGTTAIFWGKVVEQQLRLMHADGILGSVGAWSELGRFVFRPRGLQSLLKPYLAFFKVNFHPWQHDNRALLEAWKREAALSPEYRRASAA